MRTEDIRDVALRAWVERYTTEQAERRRSAKLGTNDLKDLWREFGEGDWSAFRELCEIRPRAYARFEPFEVQKAIATRMAQAPPIVRNGVTYGCPYSMGLEVAALRGLLGEDRHPRVVEEVLFNP